MARPRTAEALNIPARAVEETLNLLREAPETLSLAVIARRVGCSAPALYSHFSGKADLLEKTRAAAFKRLAEQKRERYAGPNADPIGRLREGGKAFVALARENPALYRLLYAPTHEGSEAGGGVTEDAVSALAAGVRAAQQAGYAPGAEAGDVAHMMWFAVHGAIMMVLDRQLRGSDADRWAQADQVVETIVALLSPRRAERNP